MARKIFQKYTKSFGGKIWADLHSVSPDNVFVTKIDRVYLEKFSAIKHFLKFLYQSFCTSLSIKFLVRPSNTSNIFLQLVAHKVTLQGEIQFVAPITFCLISKHLCCKQEKYLLPLATQKFTEQVESKTRNKLYLALQRNLVRD